jgi:oligopeptide transport system substrate-binding protein
MVRMRQRLVRTVLIGILLLFTTTSMVHTAAAPEVRLPPIRAQLNPENIFTITLEDSDDPILFDVHIASDSNSLLVLGGLYEGLYSFDPQSSLPRFALAEKAVISEDGLQWTFTLRNSLRFSNGDPINAQSIVDSWIWLLSQAEKRESSFMASLLDVIKGANAFRKGDINATGVGIRATDSNTLVVQLVSPAPYLPSLLCNSAFAAIHPNNRQNGFANEPMSIISSGPFVLSEVSGKDYILKKNPWYWDYENTFSDYIRIEFQSGLELVLDYLEDKIDWSQAYIPAGLLERIEDLHLHPEYSTGFFYFSASTGPYVDPRIRKALSLLIPWDTARNLSGQVFPTNRIIPDFEPLNKEERDWEQNDYQRAMTYLQEAGFPKGEKLPTLTMAIHRGSQLLETAHFIADIWSRELGITVVLDVVPLNIYSSIPSQSPYDFAYITWIGDFLDPFAFLNLWLSDSSYNLGNYHDDIFDSIMKDAFLTDDSVQRMELIEKAEKRLLTEAAVFPLSHGLSSNIVNTKRVFGWYDNPLNIHPLKYLGRK